MPKKFGVERGGITIFRRRFCLTVPKFFIGEHFGVSEKFFYRKFSCIGGGGASRFCRNFSSHRTETKSFVKEPFCFPEIFWYRKKIMEKRGLITIFSRIFWAHSAEKFYGHPFNVSENLGYRKILCLIGGITIFRRKFFVSQCRKISWASLQCLRKFGVSKNFMHMHKYHKFSSKIFTLTVPKNFVNEPFSVSPISGIKKC